MNTKLEFEPECSVCNGERTTSGQPCVCTLASQVHPNMARPSIPVARPLAPTHAEDLAALKARHYGGCDAAQFLRNVAADVLLALRNTDREPLALLLEDALRGVVAQQRDREADRARFTDPAFNRWLDEGISDAGHTVWDAVASTCDAWHGWENRPHYADRSPEPSSDDLSYDAFDVLAEVRSARANWPAFNSAHEGFAVLLEEVDELKAHVWTNQRKRDLAAMRKEAMQVAAMALRFMGECCSEATGRK